jgi:SPP1 gp7 family putative phage head morphogenesis protein
MPTTPPQLIEQASRHISHLERLKSQDVKVLRETLANIEANLLGRLARNDITAWSRSRAEAQLLAFREVLRDGYRQELIPQIFRQIDELSLYEAGFEARSLGNITINYDYRLPTDNQVLTAVRVNPLSIRGPDNGALLEPFLQNWSDRQIAATTGAIRAGFAQGETTSQVIRNLRDTVFPANDTGLQSTVRTALQHSANQARQATWQANSDIVKRVQWLSVLDARTSDQCMALSGQIFPIDEGPRPPIHINCRSSTVAVLDDRFAFLEEGATQSARDPETGEVVSVPANQTYYGWLKTQPAAVQDSIIGPTKGKLLRDGGLSSQRFSELQLGKQFQPLTLYGRDLPGGGREMGMIDLEPTAFIKAGLG